MRLTFLGVRGSTPAPGSDFVRYGGHTSCIAVSREADQCPTLALDAGTGLRCLTGLLDGQAFRGSLLVSHLHWDHFQGVPFFAAGDRDDSRVDVYVPAQDGRTGRDLVAQLMSPPAFPIAPEGLRGSWSFRAQPAGIFSTEDFEVTACDVVHKGGRTYAYVIAADGASVAYVPDHAPNAGVDEATLTALAGVDVLVHDAQFLEPERSIADAYGHATVGDAVALAERVNARSLVLFHHGPNRRDDAMDRITDGLTTDIPIVVAREGLVLDVPAQ
jgi:phosphoribosyl 1,2-cyclic phosphodiesterase